MKRLLFIISSLGAALTLFVSAPAGAAATLFQSSFQGDIAEAFFDHADGCVETFTAVFAVSGTVKSTGHPTAASEADAFIDQFDSCNGIELFFAFGTLQDLPAGAFTTSDFSSSALNVSIPGTDMNGDPVTIDVSVNWTGTGGPVTQQEHFTFNSRDFHESDRFTGTFPATVSASGSVAVGSTNYAPDAATFATFGTVKSGSIFISH